MVHNGKRYIFEKFGHFNNKAGSIFFSIFMSNIDANLPILFALSREQHSAAAAAAVATGEVKTTKVSPFTFASSLSLVWY